MHSEQIVIQRHTVEKLLQDDRPCIAVGTTAMRTLESLYWFGVQLTKDPDAVMDIQKLYPYMGHAVDKRVALEAVLKAFDTRGTSVITGHTSIYLLPGYRFRICQGLITNFHQPGSTLLLLIAAFAGPDWKRIYEEALSRRYRFLSYGDSSLLIP